VLALFALGWFSAYARRTGMFAGDWGWEFWLYFVGCSLMQTTLHELGHASAAWTLGFRVRKVSIGPLVFWNDRHGRRFRFEWKRLFDASGYVGAAPVTGEHARPRFMAVIAAGPAASLLAGALFAMVFFLLPGTPWQSWWRIAAFNSVLGFYYGIASLTPLGYSDGSMLFHLALQTVPGRQLMNRILLTQVQEDAEACHGRANFEEEVKLREKGLRLALEDGPGSALLVAVWHQTLGSAKMACDDWPGAVAEYRECLEFEAECTAHPPLAANAWSGLQKASAMRHDLAEARRVYAAVAPINEGQRQRIATAPAGPSPAPCWRRSTVTRASGRRRCRRLRKRSRCFRRTGTASCCGPCCMQAGPSVSCNWAAPRPA
jgi:hypothetical protein